MTITIEIGTPEQKREITSELDGFVQGLSNLEEAPSLAAIIVPADFEATVRTMEHRNDYSAQRGIPGSSITASAKIVYEGATASIVLSRDLYTSSNDTLTRLFTFLHEVIHVSNKSKLPKPPQQYSLALYEHNVYAMYDEYLADRLAYNIVDSTIDSKTTIWEQSMASSVSGFRDLLSDKKYWLQLHEAVGQFRVDGDLEAFFPKVNPVFDVVSLSIAHLQAILDQYPQYGTGRQESYFMNDATQALMATFKSHYDNHSFDLSDALGAVVDFMKKFGVHFVEKDTTHYCHVLDIRENG